MTTQEKIAHLLIKAGESLAIAESCSGGLLSSKITDIPGSSDFFKGSVIAYNNDAKSKLLKVPPEPLKKYGAVSTETAIAMAKGVRKVFNTDFGIAITGIAGPGGGSKTKPVGTVYIAVQTADESLCLQCHFKGSRLQIKSQSARQALKLLLEFLD